MPKVGIGWNDRGNVNHDLVGLDLDRLQRLGILNGDDQGRYREVASGLRLQAILLHPFPINARFNTAFNSQFPDEKQVYENMDQFHGSTSRRNPNRPSTDKKLIKDRIGPYVIGHKLAKPASELYKTFVDTCM